MHSWSVYSCNSVYVHTSIERKMSMKIQDSYRQHARSQHVLLIGRLKATCVFSRGLKEAYCRWIML